MSTSVDGKGKRRGPPKRRWQNYLLDRRFQLKYTGYVVLVTVLVTAVVGGWLGRTAYVYSHGMTQMLTMQSGSSVEVDDQLQALFEAEAAKEDQALILRIIGGIVLLIVVLALALGVTGILVTHRVVGPAYKLKLLFGQVQRGSLDIQGAFRKGDELQDVGDAFATMVSALRERKAEELSMLEAAIADAEAKGASETSLGGFRDLAARFRRNLGASAPGRG